ncbi:MAG TPA: TonB-dependent receptor [Epsilonproteobacteria bacterium]|nr:TonB-dependent receptor [Campylobacterota bacterium]
MKHYLGFGMALYLPLNLLYGQNIKLEDITISATPVSEQDAFDIPCQIDSLSSQDITKKSSASLGKILSSLSGVNSISTGTQASKPAIRGLYNDRIKILSNSNPTDFQNYGIRHIANIDPLLVDRIEVIRGASGVLYGSDAMGGVVNTIDASYLVAESGEQKFQGKLITQYATNNNEKAFALKTQSAIGKLGVNVAVSKRDGDDFKTGKSEKWKKQTVCNLPLFAKEMPFTDFKHTSAKIGANYSGDDFTTKIQYTFWEGKQNYLGHTPPPDLSAIVSAGQILTNHETQAMFTKILNQWEIEGRYSHTYNKREALTNSPYQRIAELRDTPGFLSIDTHRDDFRLALKHPMVGPFIGEIGLQGYTKNQKLKSGQLIPSAKEDGLALYLFEEAEFERWIVQAGARYDTKKIKAQTTGTSRYFVENNFYDHTNNNQSFESIAGVIGATYKINEMFALAANLTRGFRSPSIFELFAGGVHGGVQAFQLGNPNLKAETSHGIDLSLRYKKERNFANLTLHANAIDNYIYLQNTGQKRDNFVEMKHEQTDAYLYGIEFSSQFALTPTAMIGVSAEYLKGRDKTNKRKLGYIPSNNLTLGITQALPDFKSITSPQITIDGRFVQKQKVAFEFEPFAQYNKTPFGTADTSGYGLVDIGFSCDIKTQKNLLNLGVNVSNVFDKGYRDYLDTYKGYGLSMGRNIVLI